MNEEKKEIANETDEAAAVAEFVRKEVGDWNDEVKTRARFKALSGQRSDWEPLYLFWRESHWTASCVITMKKFEEFGGGSREAVVILNYLSATGKGTHLILNKPDSIEGVKVCLAPAAVSTASSTDYSILHLTWTVQKLEKQIDLIDQRYEKTKNSALTCLRSGNKRVALRFAKEMKLISLSRERCTALLDRVENVLGVIEDAESSKKVSDAIQNSTHALKENMINIEEVEMCLKEVDENVDSLKRLDDALASTPAYAEMDDEEMEDEFNKLQLEMKSETRKTETDISTGVAEVSEMTDTLSEALSNL